MSDDIPQWARQRSGELVGTEGSDEVCLSRVWTAFARYIAAHEEPPVDPLQAAIHALGCKAEFSVGVSSVLFSDPVDSEAKDFARELAANLRKELAKAGLEIREVRT